MDSSNHSVTIMLTRLRDGDQVAAEQIWNAFFDRVKALAHAKLGALPRCATDEEDIALSAINALYVGARHGSFERLENRDDLWQILCMLTTRKAASAWRRHNARGGKLAQEATPIDELTAQGLDYIVSGQPNDEFFDSLSQRCREMLEELEPRLREVAAMRLHGYTNQEIAGKIGRSVATVERYMKMVREQWTEA